MSEEEFNGLLNLQGSARGVISSSLAICLMDQTETCFARIRSAVTRSEQVDAYRCGFRQLMLLRDRHHYIVPTEVELFPILDLGQLNRVLDSIFLKNRLLRSMITMAHNEYYFVEVGAPRFSVEDCVDLSSYEPKTRNLLFNRVRLYFQSLLIASPKTDKPLFGVVPVRLTATRYVLLAAFDHTIADFASARLFVVYVRSALWRIRSGLDTPLTQTTRTDKRSDYKHYLSAVETVEHDRVDSWLLGHPEFRQYVAAVGLIRAKFENELPRFGQAVLLEYRLESADRVRDAPELALHLFLELSFRNLSIEALPVHVVREGRLFGGTDYRKTMGDFHTMIPVAFGREERLTAAASYERVIAVEKLLLSQGVNVEYLCKRDGANESTALIFREYVNFNYVGKLTSSEEAGFLTLPVVNYRCLSYLYRDRLRFIVYNGIWSGLEIADLGLAVIQES